MGYNLSIGEAILDWSEDVVRIDCAGVTLPDAPAFGEPTDHTNQRWPSYSAWADFCDTLGIRDLMFNVRNGGAGSFFWEGEHHEPLITEHPGAAPITSAHLAFVEAALAKYRQQYPDHIAQYPPPKPDAKPVMGSCYRQEDLVDDPRFDPTLCRAEWLVFWLRWALANCKQPVFVNS